MPTRANRSTKPAGWMSLLALPPRSSSRLAGTLMKRKPRLASARRSMRRSTRLSSENRKPRSASADRLSFSIDPAARIALWVNSSTIAGAIARRADHFRAHLLIETAVRSSLQRFLARLLPQVEALDGPKGLRWSIDVDPLEVD